MLFVGQCITLTQFQYKNLQFQQKPIKKLSKKSTKSAKIVKKNNNVAHNGNLQHCNTKKHVKTDKKLQKKAQMC